MTPWGIFGICSLALLVGGMYVGSVFDRVEKHQEQLRNLISIQALMAEQALDEEKRDKLSIIIRTELSKYPELEREIIGGIKTDIILRFPQLKSDCVIMKLSDQLTCLEDAVYYLRGKIIEKQKEILSNELGRWSRFAKPSYKEYFGVENPISKEGK